MLNQECLDHLLIVAAVGGKHEISSSNLEILFWKYQLTEDEKALAREYLQHKSINVVETESDSQEMWQGEEEVIDEDIEDDELVFSEPNDNVENRPPEELQDLPPSIASRWNKLTLREKKVLTYHFGIAGEVAHTLEETADAFGVSPERIKQIKCKAYRTCHAIRATKIKDFLCSESDNTQD